MNMNYSRPNESTQNVEISIPHAVRVVRTIHVGLPATARTSTLPPDTSTTKSKESSFQIAAFVIDHPIFAMLVPWWKARNLKSCKLNYKQAAGISPRLRQGND
jgi:hypothetical protein